MHLTAPLRTTPSERSAGVLVGVVGPSWVVEQISLDGDGILAVPTSDLVGSSLLSVVHPGDVPDLQAAGAAACHHGHGIGTALQVGAPGRWRPVRVVLTPMVGGELGFTIGDAGAESAEQRLAALEHHLRRIAREVEASGISSGMSAVPTEHPGLVSELALDGLSDRQQEVLRRLLQGERVPRIARNLFLSPSTVRNHLTAIFAKFGVHSQEELIEHMRSMSTTQRSA